jgi:hypothetical protein
MNRATINLLLTLFVACVISGHAQGVIGTPITVTTSPNPSLYGQVLTLTAAVQSAANGTKVTFSDGGNVLGSSRVSGGQAVLRTALLSPGMHQLGARLAGGGSTQQSGQASQTVNSTASYALQAPSPIASQLNLGSVPIVADFNGDGKPDLAYPFYPGVGVLLGRGDSAFSPQITSSISSNGCLAWLVAGDFDTDGFTDIVVSGCGITSFLGGNGDGSFRPAVSIISNNSGPQGPMAVGDFDQDGYPDLVVASGSGVWVLRGRGDGTFQVPVQVTLDSPSTSLVVADFNSDGKADVAVGLDFGGQGNHAVAVLLGKGDGGFLAPVYSGTAPGRSLVLGDFNGDGVPDLAGSGSYPNAPNLFLGNGDGSFRGVSLGLQASSYATADFNADGKSDLITVDGGALKVYISRGDGTFADPVTYAVQTGVFFVVAGEFSGDGQPDLLVAIQTGLNIMLGFSSPREAGNRCVAQRRCHAGRPSVVHDQRDKRRGWRAHCALGPGHRTRRVATLLFHHVRPRLELLREFLLSQRRPEPRRRLSAHHRDNDCLARSLRTGYQSGFGNRWKLIAGNRYGYGSRVALGADTGRPQWLGGCTDQPDLPFLELVRGGLLRSLFRYNITTAPTGRQPTEFLLSAGNTECLHHLLLASGGAQRGRPDGFYHCIFHDYVKRQPESDYCKSARYRRLGLHRGHKQ